MTQPKREVNIGFYYLHTNGELIFKKFEPESDSPFVQKVWAVDPMDRGNAWIICIEALAMGANRSRVMELAEKWSLTDEDAQEFTGRSGLRLFMDGDQWCATFEDFTNLQESQTGFGRTALEALSELARPELVGVRRVEGER